jgi:hypothetical protein
MVLAAAALVLLIARYGATLSAPASTAPPAAGRIAAPADNVFLHLLIALTAVVVVGRMLGRAFVAVGQPPVIGEVIAACSSDPRCSASSRQRPTSSSCRRRWSPFWGSSRSWASSSTCSWSASIWTQT